MKIVQIFAFASTISSVIHGNEYLTRASDTMKSTMKEENHIQRGSLDATTKDYPYIASLRLEELDTSFCSGTLIVSQYILTAGHCIKTETDVVIAHFGTSFGAGSTGEQIKVISSYRYQTNLYDVGLLKLETPSMQKTATLCAADGSDHPIGTKATALEWKMTEDGSLSHTLQEVHVALISSTECNMQYNNSDNMEGMICAGYEGVKDSCSGGNGGPLVTADDILIGFASSRGKCGVNVGIYTRLTFVLDYINAILSGDTGATTLADSIGKSTVKEPTSSVTLVGATSTPAVALASTAVAQMVPIASDCTFHRHLSEEPAAATEEPKPATVDEMEDAIEKDMDSAEKAKKIVHAVTAEADKEIEMMSDDSSMDGKIANILRTKVAAEEEEKVLDEEIKEDEEQEEEIYKEEIEKFIEDEDAIEQEEKEDDTSAKTSDKSSKKTSTKAKAKSKEQEETTKATKKSAKKAKGEEEKELEEEKKLEKLEEKEDKVEEAKAEAKELEEEFEEELEEEEAEKEKAEEEEDDKEDEDEDKGDEDEDKEDEDEEDEDEAKEDEDEDEEDEDEAKEDEDEAKEDEDEAKEDEDEAKEDEDEDK